jgi:hypothetical protein
VESKNPFVKNETQFMQIKNILNGIFDFSNNFPHQIFREEYSTYYFMDIAFVRGGTTWKIFQSLALDAHDKNIILSVIDPDPYAEFYPKNGYINCAIVPLNILNEQYYYDYLGCNNYQIIGNSNVVVWASPSCKWGVYGDFDLETAILSIRNDVNINHQIMVDKAWRGLDDALNIWMPQIFVNKGMKVPEEIVELLRKNYS